MPNAADLGFIHQYVVPTHGAAGDGLTLLLLHGTGGDENDLLELGRLLAPGAALLSPRGKVLERGMPRFFRRLAEGVFDLDDLRLRANELADFVAQAATTYGFDPARVVAVGFSNGANIATSALLLRPETLAGAALFHPQFTLETEARPELAAKRIFIAAGRRDPLVPPTETERLAAQLRQYGATVSESWQPGGHMLTQAEALAARDWLAAQPW
ncbi:MAG TPA: alpha/beta hydrolase [Ktedonobacterales bacterium]